MSEQKYNAFISYRRTGHDVEVAKEVQHSLERFRIPAEIRRSTGRERIDRIFRDQEELEITSDLSGRIEDALRASEYLIVICSPGYCESKWCLHELETFIQLRGRERVLCVLSEGEPPSVFPELLLHCTEEGTAEDGTKITVEVTKEPLACDYRGDFKQARKTELPRLAAVMLGCSYDELVMRRERYQRKRLAVVFSAAAVLAVAAISWLLWSNAQISRSYRQSQISESRLLAMKSLDAFTGQDRLVALNAAMDALTGGDADRPVTDEAQYALSQASYAYFTPYRWLETWRVDEVNDLTEFFVNRDQSCLVCMDRSGVFRSFALKTKEQLCTFQVTEHVVPSTPLEGKDGELLCYDGADVVSVDYRTGEENWRVPLRYQRIGGVSRSSSGEYIAAADSFAVQVMTADGVPYLSLPLPEDGDGYITDLCWAPDDSRIAVKLKVTGESAYRLGIFDFGTSEYTQLEPKFHTVSLFCFDRDGIFYLLGDNRAASSERVRGSTVLTPVASSFMAFQDEELLWEREIPAAMLTDKVSMKILEQPEKELFLAAGSKVFVFSGAGEAIGELEVRKDILTLLTADSASVTFVTWDGELGAGFPATGECVLNRFFPTEPDRVITAEGDSLEDYRYFVLYEGNLGIYEGVFDESVSLFDGESFANPPDGFLCCGDRLMLLEDRTLRLYSLENRSMESTVELDSGDAWHPLAAIDGTAYLLGIKGEEGVFSVLALDMEEGSVLREDRLPVCDFFANSGLLRHPFSREDAIYLNAFYTGVSPVAVQGDCVYLHDREDCNRILIYRLTDGKTETLDLNEKLESGRMMIYEENSFLLPAPLAVSPDGSLIFTACTESDSGDRQAVLIRTEDGSLVTLPVEPDDLSSVAFTDDGVVFSARDGLYVCAADGTVRNTIPYSRDNAVSFAWNAGRLYCVFPDGRLTIYDGAGAEIRTVPLSFDLSMDVINGKAFRYVFTPARLYLFCGNEMNAVTLESESETAVYYAASILTRLADRNELLVYSYDREKVATAGDMSYYPGVFREYTVAELIERARTQLAEYEPA